MELESPKLSFQWNILLHNKDDLPDAATIHPSFFMGAYDSGFYEIGLRVKHFSKLNTRSNPCSQYHSKSCRDVHLQKKIAKLYNCQIPIMNSGPHLDVLELTKLLHCNKSVILEMISMTVMDLKSCPASLRPCDHTEYSIDELYPSNHYLQRQTSFRISYSQTHTEHYESKIKVDEEALIGKIGGLLGIMLGFSFIRLVDMFDQIWDFISYIIPQM